MIETLDAWMSWLALGVFLMGGGMMFLGDRFSQPGILGGGLAAIGAAASISGLESMLTRKAAFVPWSLAGGKTTSYSGLSALLWGVLFLIFGGLGMLAGVSIALLPGGWDAVVAWAFQSSLGWAVLGLGLGILAFTLGLIRVISGNAFADPTYGTRLMDIGERLGGLLLMLLGVGLLCAGLTAGLAPELGKSVLLRAASLIFSGSP